MAGKMNVYNEMVKAQLESISSDPTGIIGMVYFNTTSNISKYYNGSAWKTFLAADFSNVTGTLAVANGGTGVTTSTGSGNVVLSTSPTLVTPVLGTPASGTLTNATGLPIDGGTINTLPVSRGGTGQTTATAAFNALSPTTTIGDISYHNGTDDVRLPIGTDGQALKVLSGIPSWGDGGAGAGEINAILNPSAASATTGWSDDANHSKTRLTSGSPLDPVIATAFRFTKDNTNVSTETSTSGVYYPFTLPTGLESKKLKVEFYCIVPATGVWKVSVYDGSTRLALSTDSSGSTTLPAGVTGKFVTYFDATANNSYTVSFTETAGVATNLDATNIIVGPGIQPQGAVVGEWQTYTPAITGQGTVTITYAEWRRVGSNMEIRARWTAGTVDGSNLTVKLPTGFNHNNSTNDALCTGSMVTSYGGSNQGGIFPILSTGDTTVLYWTHNNSRSGTAGLVGNAVTVNGSVVHCTATFPVSQFAGSGTVNLAQNDVEYASNSGTWNTASDTSSFIYGPSGSTISSDLSQDSAKRVRFQTPIQPTDCIELEMDVAGNGRWLPMIGCSSDTGTADRAVESSRRENTVNYGVSYQTVNSTDVDILFNRYFRANGATYGSAGDGWSVFSNSKWRVKKSSGGQAVGFGMATARSKGLDYATSYVVGASQSSLADNTVTDVSGSSLSLPAGAYLIEFGVNGYIDFSTVHSYAEIETRVRDASNNTLLNDACGFTQASSGRSRCDNSGAGQITLSADTSIKLSCAIAVVGGTGISRNVQKGYIIATRVS